MSLRECPSSRAVAAELMTPNPRTCSPFSTVLEAVMIFRAADCGAVPVLDQGKPVGVLTDRDVALAVAEFPDLAARPVSDIMTRRVVSVAPDTSIEIVKEKFGDAGVRRLLVVDTDGRLVGVIAWADLANAVSLRALGEVVTEVVEQS
jgi:CBS domain-containing protein